jgi:hypothetical protein
MPDWVLELILGAYLAAVYLALATVGWWLPNLIDHGIRKGWW